MSQSPERWRPVHQIEIDVDTLTSTEPLDVTAGDRLWIEALRRGQVVGVIDGRAEGTELPASVLRKLGDLKDLEFSPLELLSDELLPKASVVVPTICENPTELVRPVESLLALDYPDFEIIVVDNRSGVGCDPLPALPGGEHVRVFEQPKPGVSAARNLGIAMSECDFIAFTDDDATVDTNWLLRSKQLAGSSYPWSSKRSHSYGSRSFTAASARRSAPRI